MQGIKDFIEGAEIKRMNEHANELFKYIERKNANDSDRAEEIRVLEHYVRVELEEAQNPKGESVECPDNSRIEGDCSDEPEDMDFYEEVGKVAFEKQKGVISEMIEEGIEEAFRQEAMQKRIRSMYDV